MEEYLMSMLIEVSKERQKEKKLPLKERNLLYSNETGGISDLSFNETNTCAVLLKYSSKNKEPIAFGLPSIDAFFSALTLMFYKDEENEYNQFNHETLNPIMRAMAKEIKSHSRSSASISKEATQIYKKFQEDSSIPEDYKIIAALLASPMSKISPKDREIVVKNLREIALLMPHSRETHALYNLADKISDTNTSVEGLVLSFKGKYGTEHNLWKDNKTKEGIWFPYSEIEKKLFNPIIKPRNIVPGLYRTWAKSTNSSDLQSIFEDSLEEIKINMFDFPSSLVDAYYLAEQNELIIPEKYVIVAYKECLRQKKYNGIGNSEDIFRIEKIAEKMNINLK